MKTLFLTAFLAITIVSCNNKAKETETNATETQADSNELFACPMHPEVTGKKGEKCSKCGMELTEPVAQTGADKNIQKTETQNPSAKVGVLGQDAPLTASDYVNDIVTSYINLKNKLTMDDSKGAADKGKALLVSFNQFDTNTLNANQKKEYLEIAEDAKENAKHIGDNSGKIDHQREHFAILSKDINDLIKMFGTKRKLYQDYCPMYNEGKGAIWISETKEIKNPFYGSQMLTCGSLKKTL
ncbi:MAG: DUF3347 domain-containing protein [Candidatus Paceibacterota bacterium]